MTETGCEVRPLGIKLRMRLIDGASVSAVKIGNGLSGALQASDYELSEMHGLSDNKAK